MKKRKNRGEGYIDVCVGVICLVMVLVAAVNIFSFIALRMELDVAAEDIIEAATYSGGFEDKFDEAVECYVPVLPAFTVTRGADSFFNSAYGRVQLGERMWVTLSVQTYVKGLGIFRIPVTVSVTKTGLSEKYWK